MVALATSHTARTMRSCDMAETECARTHTAHSPQRYVLHPVCLALELGAVLLGGEAGASTRTTSHSWYLWKTWMSLFSCCCPVGSLI